MTMEGEEGSQNTHLIFSFNLFLLKHSDVQDVDKVRLKEDVLSAIKLDGMAPMFETLIADGLLELYQSALESMRATIDEELKKLDEKYEGCLAMYTTALVLATVTLNP